MLLVWGGLYLEGLILGMLRYFSLRGERLFKGSVNQGMAVIRGNSVGKKNKPLAHREGRNMVKIFDSTVT